jgi:hypothetical protein
VVIEESRRKGCVGGEKRAMLGWLKKTVGDEKPKAVDGVMSAYSALLEKFLLAIMDIAMLPIPKTQMKVLLKGLHARATTAEQENTIEAGFMFLSKFQDGVGATPIDDTMTGGKRPTQTDIAKLDRWTAWEKLSFAEMEILMAEWNCFKAGEAI